MTTNRDLYLAVADLVERHRSNVRPLDEYLRSLLNLASPYRTQSGLTSAQFVEMLTAAFTADAASIDPRFRVLADRPEEVRRFDGLGSEVAARLPEGRNP